MLNLKHSKRWIKSVQISKAVSPIEELSSVLILMRRDNVEQSWLVEYDQQRIVKSEQETKYKNLIKSTKTTFIFWNY